jgi:hypothetical protein
MVGGVADVPAGLGNHPDFAGVGEGIEAFGVQTAGGEVELVGLRAGLAGQDGGAVHAGGEHATAALKNGADGLDVAGFAGERLGEDDDGFGAGLGGEVGEGLLPTLDGVVGAEQRFVGGAGAMRPAR